MRIHALKQVIEAPQIKHHFTSARLSARGFALVSTELMPPRRSF
ncbi:hypothetical protein X732_29040 [Mesorhizobium sp. L2C066B000]|nr:hypothetical protein X732_29040 [Mesorhizobium sp. L2C066B000]